LDKLTKHKGTGSKIDNNTTIFIMDYMNKHCPQCKTELIYSYRFDTSDNYAKNIIDLDKSLSRNEVYYEPDRVCLKCFNKTTSYDQETAKEKKIQWAKNKEFYKKVFWVIIGILIFFFIYIYLPESDIYGPGYDPERPGYDTYKLNPEHKTHISYPI